MLSSGLSQSYSAHGDKNIVKLSKLTETNRRFGGGRALEPPPINQVTFVKSYNCFTVEILNENICDP